jgi:uncharacterized membrane protein
MEPKRSKYDTNPLDENVADRATQSWGNPAPADEGTGQIGRGATRAMDPKTDRQSRNHPQAEAPTRRMDDSYPSVFAYGQSHQETYQPPQPLANIYQPPPVAPAQVYQPPPVATNFGAPGSRKIAGIGIPEKWAVILPYLPIGFLIAIAASVVELLLVPRTETRVRFHAAQGMVLQIGLTALSIVFGFADLVVSGRFTGGSLLRLASFVFLIISMVRVWKGKPHHIALLDQATNWFNEKIAPRK